MHDFDADFDADFESDFDADFDADFEADFDADFDTDFDADFDVDFDADLRSDLEEDLKAGSVRWLVLSPVGHREPRQQACCRGRVAAARHRHDLGNSLGEYATPPM